MQITSLQNERVKLVRALQNSGKTRREQRLLVLEGVRLVSDALSSGVVPAFVFQAEYTPAVQALLPQLEAQFTPVLEVTPEIMEHVSDTQTPQGILAVVPMPDLSPPEHLTLTLILNRIGDPGNLGTLLRTGAAAGVDLVLLTPGSVDAYSPKVLRAGMGAQFRLPIQRQDWDEIAITLKDSAIYVGAASADVAYTAIDWTQPSALVIGSEAHGVQSEAYRIARQTIAVPMAGQSESLNAGAAAAVMLFEARRQRL